MITGFDLIRELVPKNIIFHLKKNPFGEKT